MNEETKNENTTPTTPLEGSAFARVLGRIMEARGIHADQEHALELAEKSGLDAEAFRARLVNEPGDGLSALSGLDKVLDLSKAEMDVLALAYVYEEEPVDLDADPRADWTQWEKDEFDARADHEEWSHARSIFSPMVAISREVGNPALNAAMEKVLAEVEGEYNRTLDVLEELREQGA